MSVLRLERQPAAVPRLQPARHRARPPARAPPPAGRHRGARAHAAVEDDGPVTLDRAGLGGEPPELEVPRPGDPAGGVLVVLAHVDELDLTARVARGDVSGRDVDLGGEDML